MCQRIDDFPKFLMIFKTFVKFLYVFEIGNENRENAVLSRWVGGKGLHPPPPLFTSSQTDNKKTISITPGLRGGSRGGLLRKSTRERFSQGVLAPPETQR